MENCVDRLISREISAKCDGLVQGIEKDGIIINREDISEYTIEHGIVKSLVLKPGKKGYRIQQLGNTPFTGTQSSFEAGTYVNTFTHNVAFVVLDASPEVSEKVIEPLANGEFVVILKTKNDNKEGEKEYRHKIYGIAQGLRQSEGTSEAYSDDTLGGWAVTLQETKSPYSALYVDDETVDIDSLVGSNSSTDNGNLDD